MGEDSLALIAPPCPPPDDPCLRRLLEALAAACGAPGAELTVLPSDGGPGVSARVGVAAAETTSISVPLDDGGTATLEMGGLGRAEPALLELASAALVGVIRAYRLERQTELVRAALDACSSSILLFDDGGDIVYANPPADQLLSRQTECGLEVIAVGGVHRPLVTELCVMVDAVGKEGVSISTSMALTDGTVMSADVRPIVASRGSGTRGVVALLQLLSPAIDCLTAPFAMAHGLSPRESEVLGLVLAGRSTDDMATELGISPHTVRDHLKNLYRKTGAGARSELVARVAGAGAVPAGQRE